MSNDSDLKVIHYYNSILVFTGIMFASWEQLLPYVLVVGLVAVLLKVLESVRAKNRGGALPPCLPWLPVVGSLPFIGKMEIAGERFMHESKKRGKVFAFRAGSTLVTRLLCQHKTL